MISTVLNGMKFNPIEKWLNTNEMYSKPEKDWEIMPSVYVGLK